MRNPLRKAGIFAAIVIVGVAMFIIGTERKSTIGEDWIAVVLTILGPMSALMAFIWLVRSTFIIHGYTRLLAGFGLVIRWHVSAGDWDKFRAADPAWVQSDPQFLANDLWIRKVTPPEGVDIIVGEKALIVDGSYHTLRRHALPELRNVGWLDNSSASGRPPDCLEFLLCYPKGKAGSQYTTLRIPVPAGARHEGMIAYKHYAPQFEDALRKGALALRNPAKTYKVCAAIAIIGSIVMAVSIGLIRLELISKYDEINYIVLAMIAGASTACALLIMGMTWLLLRAEKRDQRAAGRH